MDLYIVSVQWLSRCSGRGLIRYRRNGQDIAGRMYDSILFSEGKDEFRPPSPPLKRQRASKNSSSNCSTKVEKPLQQFFGLMKSRSDGEQPSVLSGVLQQLTDQDSQNLVLELQCVELFTNGVSWMTLLSRLINASCIQSCPSQIYLKVWSAFLKGLNDWNSTAEGN